MIYDFDLEFAKNKSRKKQTDDMLTDFVIHALSVLVFFCKIVPKTLPRVLFYVIIYLLKIVI